MNLLQVNNVTKSFETGEGTLSVLRGVSLELISGKSLALTGESGSGKSTLLYLIGGLDVPDQGRIQILGRDIANLDDPSRAAIRRGTVGVVFQQFNLIPSLNVAANLSFHARLSGSEDKSWTEHLVHYLGLGTLLNRFPEQLSGGQQQRVAIGRTLAARPALVLADEPTGNLDEATADVVMNLLLLDQQVHLQAGLIA
ncbi:MAG: ABC transporter ATP-binding protein [Rhodobacteraceae bacterium]|nr:ABC transporter ATP-binding protein [Paracoccaceae bacterium]